MRKARKGEAFRLSANTHNAMIDAARREGNRGMDFEGQRLYGHLDHGTVTIKNASGADCDRFEILGVDVPIYTPTDNENTFVNQMGLEGVTPDVDDHTGLFVVLLEPLADGKIGRGLLSGICPVKVDVQDEADGYADVTDAETGYLTSGTTGAAQILWKESGTGEKWAVVRLGAYQPPFAIEIDGCCKIDQANATTRYSNTWTCDNDEVANTEERLLIHLAKPWVIPAAATNPAGKSIELYVYEWADIEDEAVPDLVSPPYWAVAWKAMHFELRPIVDDFDPNSGVSAPTWSEVAGGSPQVDDVTTTPDTDSYANFWLRVTGSEDLRDDDTQDDRWLNEPIAHWPDGWTGSAWAGKTVKGFEMRAKVPKIDGVDATTWFKRLTAKQNRSKVLLV